MIDEFELPVVYKGQNRLLPARLVPMGYSHKFQVQAEGWELWLEPDEEGRYRAVLDPSMTTLPDPALVAAVVEGLERALA